MTNTIVLLSVLLQTNWRDTTVMNGGMHIQVGRVQTNYVVSPPAGYIKKDTLWVTSAQLELSVGRYPILTSQPFFGPYSLIREVPQRNVLIVSNVNWDIYWPPYKASTNPWIIPRDIIMTNTGFGGTVPARMPPGL